jgi:hypothetical protein
MLFLAVVMDLSDYFIRAISIMSLAKNLSVDGDVYRWSGSLHELKLFVRNFDSQREV